MSWFIYAFACALSLATADALSKKVLDDNTDSYIVAWVLNVHTISQGFLVPFKAIAEEKGSVLMIIVAFVFSIGACLGKIAVQHSSPEFFSVIYIFLLSLVLFIIISLKSKHFLSKSISRPIPFIFIGLLIAIMIITHLKAISLIEVSHMVSVKRLSILFGVLCGIMFFKETNIKERLLGATVMVSGIIVIAVI